MGGGGIPHIVDITASVATKLKYKHPLILSTSTLRENCLYETVFERFGIEIIQFPFQEIVSEGIEAVKQNLCLEKIATDISNVITAKNNDIDSVIYGCTEIDLLMKSVGHPYPKYIDSNQALADFCWDFINGEMIDNRIRLFAGNMLAYHG